MAEDRCRERQWKRLVKEQVRCELERRTQVNHRTGVDIRTTSSKPGAGCVPGQVQQKPVYWLGGDRRGDGVSLIQAQSWNWVNSKIDVKERSQVKKSEAASTEAMIEGGLTRMNEEASVMEVE